MIGRRRFLQIAGVRSYAVANAVHAQAPEVVKRIGVLVDIEPDRPLRPPQAALDRLRARGWIEGRNLAYEFRHSDRADLLPGLAQELVQAKVDLIFTFNTRVTRIAKAATTTIPILFEVGEDPVANGLVSSLARPGGNLTGFAYGLFDDKQLDIFKQALPKASRVVFPLATPSAAAKRAAQILGIEIVPSPVAGPSALDGFFQAVRKIRPDGVVLPNVQWINGNASRFAKDFLAAGMPAISTEPAFTRAGGLLSYGPEAIIERRSDIVDALLRGANSRDIAVEMPTHFRLAVNLVTAKAFGVAIPSTLLIQAHDVVRS